MRVVFMGSAELACASLVALAGRPATTLAAVVTQPGRPKGRRLQAEPGPVERAAAGLGLPVLTPLRVNAPDSLAALRALAPEVVVVVAYGQLLGRELLDLPPLGCVNVHTSLLPRYRGAAPIQWAIAHGDAVTGVTTMRMDAGMDTGGILLQREVTILPEDTAGTLHARLAGVGAALLMETLDGLAAGSLVAQPQDGSLATTAPKLRKEDGEIDWTLPAVQLYNRIRAFTPWPGAQCRIPDAVDPCARLKVLRAAVEGGAGQPGVVLDVGGAGPLVATGAGALRLLAVQPPGGRVMPADAYLRGHPWRTGVNLSL